MSNITNIIGHHTFYPITTTSLRDRRTQLLQVRFNRLARHVQPTDAHGNWYCTGVSRHKVMAVDVFFCPVIEQEAISVLILLFAIGLPALQTDCLACQLSLPQCNSSLSTDHMRMEPSDSLPLPLLSPQISLHGQSLCWSE